MAKEKVLSFKGKGTSVCSAFPALKNGGAKVVFAYDGNSLFGYLEAIGEANKCFMVTEIGGQKRSEFTSEAGIEKFSAIFNGGYQTSITSMDESTGMVEGSISYFEETEKKAVLVENGEVSLPEDVKELVSEKVSSGLISKDLADKKITYMIENGYTPLDIKEAVDYWFGDCNQSVPNLYRDPTLTYRKRQGVVLKLGRKILRGHSCILEGPKSTGKNTLINSVLWIYGLESVEHTASIQDSKCDYISSDRTDNSSVEALHNVNMEQVVEGRMTELSRMNGDRKGDYSDMEKRDLLAKYMFEKLSAEAASVHIISDYEAYAVWLLDPKKVLVLDEANMADANLLVSLFHPILDGSVREVHIPGKGFVKLREKPMMFQTMNIGYAGEQERNSATVSRFDAVNVPQPKSILPILKSSVAHTLKKDGIEQVIPDDYFTQAERFYTVCKKAVEGNGQATSLSDQVLNIRGFVRALEMCGCYYGRTTLKEELEDAVVTPCPTSERVSLQALLEASVNC